MPTLHLLGTGSAVTDPHRTTTMLAVQDGTSTFVVDCGGDVIHRMLRAGLHPDTLTGLFITHEHPDHVGGFPLFVEKVFMHGRKRPLPVYGPVSAVNQARRCLDTFDTSRWDLPPIHYQVIPEQENAPVVRDEHWLITASPGIHSVPVMGLRIESRTSGAAVAYSCDTEPSEAIARLARHADLLVHEATGPTSGHSSPEDAARIARRAGARRLLLAHLPADIRDEDLSDAKAVFEPTELGKELGAYSF